MRKIQKQRKNEQKYRRVTRRKEELEVEAEEVSASEKAR